MIGPAAQALWSHWRRTPLQLFTLIAGLALATALWSGVQAVNAEARASYDAAASIVGEGQFDQLLPRAGDTIPQSQFVELRRAGWLVGPVVEGRLDLAQTSVRIVGLDPLTAPGGMGPVTLDQEIDLPTFLSGPVYFADPATAALIGGVLEGRVVADPSIAPETVLTDIGVAQVLLGREGEISRLMLAPDQPIGQPALSTIAPDVVLRPARGGADIGQLTDSFHLNLTAFGLLSFAVGLFIVHGAIGLAVEQRRPMVRTLRALGLPLRTILGTMMAEFALLALIAGGVGVVLGYVIAGALLPDVAATLRGLYGAPVDGTLELRPAWWLSGLVIALGGTAVAAAGGLWQIARMPLLASASPRAWAMSRSAGRRMQTGLAVLLLVGAAGLAAFGSGLAAGFALLGALLIGAALLLPALLDLALWTGQVVSRGVRSNWFFADTRQQLPGLSLALMALLLAMATNVGVSTMVSSFRTTFVGFLDQRLSAELYVSVETSAEGARLEAFVSGRVDEVQPILSTETRLAGMQADLFGARIGPAYSDNWTFLSSDGGDVWGRLARGDAVIVNEQLARRAGLQPGDPLDLPQGLTLPIAAVVGDYGNPIGQAILSEPVFAGLFPEIAPREFGLHTEEPGALRAALIDEFGLPEGRIINQSGIKQFSLDVFERTFTVTDALNILTLGVAAFAILMSLLTLASMRLPQLAPVWALGLTRRDLGRLELLRAALLAVLTALLALPLGLALAWVLLGVVNVEAFGWKLPMFLFPGDYARLGLFALIAALLAALLPARRLARTPPSDLLKVFANER